MRFRKKIKNAIRAFGIDIIKYKPPKRNWLKQYNINTIIDVGANVGQFALRMQEIVPHAKIYSFEPIKECYNSLVKNSQNKNIIPFNFGLGDKEGTCEINVNDFSPSSSMLEMENLHKINFEFTKNSKPETVLIKRLDDIAGNLEIKKNLFIKMDVQGYEDKVISGGLKTVQNAAVLLIEVAFKSLYKGQPLFNEIYNQLYSLGFAYMGIDGQIIDVSDGMPLFANAFFVNNYAKL